MLFFREVICGGDAAAGGGCGAPLGVWNTTEHLFRKDAQNKSVRTYFLEHSLRDGGVPEGAEFETFTEFRPCFYCRRA